MHFSKCPRAQGQCFFGTGQDVGWDQRRFAAPAHHQFSKVHHGGPALEASWSHPTLKKAMALQHAGLFLCGLMFAVMTATADEPQRLTHDGRQKSSPVFRHEGRELIYVDFADPTLFQLRRLVLADGTNELLHANSTSAEFEPTWSADGENYAHLKLRGVLSISIVVRDKQGATLNEIVPGAGFNGYRSPALSPDHSRLAFSYAERGTQQIYSSQLNGEDRRQLTDSTGLSNWPCYSHDGRSIVFGSSRDGNFEIYTVKADGTDLRRLTSHPADDSAPTWSPNGSQIAFTSARGGSNQIYIMSADGGPVTKLTSEPNKADRPTWALDFIAYSAEVPGAGVQIKKITVGTRQEVQLTNGPGNNESPTVAPNGRHIAFVATRWGKEQIAIMDADGNNVRQITFTGNNRYPSWSNR